LSTAVRDATLDALAAALAAGEVSSEQLVTTCLDRIADPDGEGARAFLTTAGERALASARAIDSLRAAGAEPSSFAGIPVSVKDLFDVRGEVTRAGSRVLDHGPATVDAAAVANWRRAGLIPVGRTNMTEFAFSGLGINPHFGTPTNPWDRANGRIPGGSSSGAAVSVSDGMAAGAVGSDTGGSCRIPAALCGLVGFKPSQSRISREGMVPLSSSLDAVGVIGRSVGCCATLESLLRGTTPDALQSVARAPRLAVPRNYFFDGVDDEVATAFERALARFAERGAEIVDIEIPELSEIPAMSAGGGLPAAESFAWHRDLIAAKADGYDPRVLSRIRRGEAQTASDLIGLHHWRERLAAAMAAALDGFDAFACPTVPIVAPTQAECEPDDEYTRLNLLMLRNPTVVNLVDGCAISVPMHPEGKPPSGLMLGGIANDDYLLRIAAWVEESR
jgi:aspartyl-tRNA(Asn)/glutamyl-tRNA(Gln) amidotransferase subunit A